MEPTKDIAWTAGGQLFGCTFCLCNSIGNQALPNSPSLGFNVGMKCFFSGHSVSGDGPAAAKSRLGCAGSERVATLQTDSIPLRFISCKIPGGEDRLAHGGPSIAAAQTEQRRPDE
jgi:hypothetical protein